MMVPCLACVGSGTAGGGIPAMGMGGGAAPSGAPWTLPRAGLDDPEGGWVARHLPPVVDAHVHLFPDAVFQALWRWFDTHAWPIRYRLYTRGVLDFLRARGVSHVVALHYAHKPGMARELNRQLAEVCRGDPFVTGTATVLPGEPGAVEVLEEAFRLGLRGVKLHCHVQCFRPDDPALDEIYACCARHRQPLVMHAGREPHSPAYRVDTRAICAAERVEHVLRNHPTLQLVVPHLGADEFTAYERLLERHGNLWLDTTMALADFLEVRSHARLLGAFPSRIMYGTDFPNLPYAWDRELVRLDRMGLPPSAVESILGGSARALWRMP